MNQYFRFWMLYIIPFLTIQSQNNMFALKAVTEERKRKDTRAKVKKKAMKFKQTCYLLLECRNGPKK